MNAEAAHFDALAGQLASHGYKLTRPRRAVLHVVAEMRESLSPAEIHARARKYYPATGLVTVYRTLDVLEGVNAVRKVHQADGCHSYAPASEGHAHHVICGNCQSVTEFEGCDLAEMFKAVQKRTGYKIEDHWLELFGLCPNCRSQGARN